MDIKDFLAQLFGRKQQQRNLPEPNPYRPPLSDTPDYGEYGVSGDLDNFRYLLGNVIDQEDPDIESFFPKNPEMQRQFIESLISDHYQTYMKRMKKHQNRLWEM